jgi:hypothetical protein
MLLFHCHNAGQNQDIKIANRRLKMCHLKIFGIIVTDENLIQEEIKRRLNSSHF